MKAIYDAKRNELRESDEVMATNKHGESYYYYPTIPCSEECRSIWKDGQVLEEGKDYAICEYYEISHTNKFDVPTACPARRPIQCDSDTGLTIGIIDSVITSFTLLDGRDLAPFAVREALSDLFSNEVFIHVLTIRGYVKEV